MGQGREYLSPREAAEWLGVSRASIYRWLREEGLRGYRLPSGKLVIVRRDLEEWIRRYPIGGWGQVEEEEESER